MRKLVVALGILLLSAQAYGVEIAGVDIAPTVTIGQKALVLNGAGIRRKFVIKVYVGALYLERKASSVEELLKDPGDKLVRMRFVHSKVEKEKIVEAFAEGIGNNSPAVAPTPDAKTFLSWIQSDCMAGDTVDVFMGSDGTVSASHNGKALGTLRNPALARAVLLIWFGEKPADAGLARGMLGKG
ncbi:MAG: chalcone isomerase family protein [Thermodesulfobacteriota bacterium]